MVGSFSKTRKKKVIKTISSGQLKESHSREDVEVLQQDFRGVFERPGDWSFPSST